MKLFDMFDLNVEVKDPGLKPYVNLQPKLIIKSRGRHSKNTERDKVNVVERLISLIQVAGHRGKKHKILCGWTTGKHTKATGILIEAFKIIQEKTKRNPVEVLIKAIENASPRDEITVIEYGGARYPQAVDTSPLRRLNIALRHIVHGSYDKAFNKKKKIAETLAEEIINTAEKSNDSYSISKKNELEKQADSAR